MPDNQTQEVLAEISTELKENATANLTGIVSQTPAAQAQEQLAGLLNQLVDTARKQQLTAEQNTQSTLNQASSSLSDRQRLEQIFTRLSEIQKGVTGQALTIAQVQNYLNQVDQIEGQLRQQVRETDNQITQGLQQAVAALAQAQSAMLDSQTCTQLEQMLGNLKQSLSQWQSQPPAGAPLQ